MSLGFLIKTVADGSWEVFYWSLGGLYYIVSLLQGGESVSQASTTVALISWVGTGVYLGSLGAMIALIIYGVNVLAETVPPRQLAPA